MIPAGTHVVEQAISLASDIAGRPLQYVDPLFPRDAAAETWTDRTLAKIAAGGFAILNPGAGWGAKCWPAESFGAVARALSQRGLAVIVNHGPGEEALADAVRDASGGAALPLKCSVGELIALTRRASVFLGGDTGPMHLAAALHVPVVALFGPTRPERNGPYGTESIVLRNPESAYNSSHTDQPDEGLMAIQPQSSDRGSRSVARRCQLADPQPKPAWTWSRVARRIRVPLGFLFAAFYIWRARPTWLSILIGVIVACVGSDHPRARLRASKERSRADDHRPLRVRAQSAVSRLDPSRHRFCSRCARHLDLCFSDSSTSRSSMFPSFKASRNICAASSPLTPTTCGVCPACCRARCGSRV